MAQEQITKSAGDSAEQRKAEEYLVDALSKELEITLAKRKWDLGEGSYIELDGFCESPLILCEAWAHIGLPKSAQKDKVMKDAFKLLFVNNILVKGEGKRILLFADHEAAAHFQGKSWMARCLKEHNIIVKIVELPPEIKTDVKKAQKMQYR